MAHALSYFTANEKPLAQLFLLLIRFAHEFLGRSCPNPT